MAEIQPVIRNVEEVQGVPCPCGSARRIITRADGAPASFHIVTVKADSEVHYHAIQCEMYHVLDGEGFVDLDGRAHPVRQGDTIFIPAGVRHRPRGKMTIVNVVIPPFDPADEHTVG
ncbi:MAG: cupin domain-containing protein [Candidatus Sumerlaeota bacterium]|nr:cupin domain-containing protein [Candidatus Sumerlaeota bacterium]